MTVYIIYVYEKETAQTKVSIKFSSSVLHRQAQPYSFKSRFIFVF